MKHNFNLKIKLGTISLILVFLLDRFLKVYSQRLSMRLNDYFVFKLNKGLAGGLALPGYLLLLVAGALVVFLIYCWLVKTEERWWLGWVILGAASNLWDRLMFGGVVDYISLPLWPSIFNLADVMIIGGCLAWILKNKIKHRPPLM